MDQKSVQPGSDVPGASPLITPSVFSCGWLDIHEVPLQDDIIYSFFYGVSNPGTPFFFFLVEGDIKIPPQDYISMLVTSFLTEKIPAGFFISIGNRSINIEYSYQIIGVFLPQQREDPVRAILDVNSLKFLVIPKGSDASGCAP